MKTKQLIFKGLMATLALSLIITGCKKEKENDKDTQAASDNEQADFVSNDIVNMSDAAANGTNSFKTDNAEQTVLSGCATVTRDTLNNADPDTITIDFGSSNCLCNDSRYRRGIIKIVQDGKWWISGSYRTVTFSNYYVNDFNVEGIHTVTANGQNNAGNYNWTISAQDMKITRSDGKSHTWTSTRNREWSSGASTPFNWLDDVYLITGNASGINVNGNSYTADITSALRREIGCRWFVSGTVVITPANKPARTMDFGNGNCDNEATVNINNTIYTITLH